MSLFKYDTSLYNDSPRAASPGDASEPMLLGTSPGSPSQQYLPEYLIGSPQVSSPRPSVPPPSWASPSTFSPLKSSFTPRTPQTPKPEERTPKPAGPPVVSLLDEEPLNSPLFTATPTRQNLERSFLPSTPVASPRTQPAIRSPSQVDPFYEQGESLTCGTQLDSTWVTVFGFPPSAASFVIQHFSQLGTIVSHKVEPRGNWMHIQYQDKLQAKKALSKNAKILGDQMMVGVTPCIDLKVMSAAGESFREEENAQGMQAMYKQSYTSHIRNYKIDRNENSRTPTRTPDFVNKALDFFFTW